MTVRVIGRVMEGESDGDHWVRAMGEGDCDGDHEGKGGSGPVL